RVTGIHLSNKYPELLTASTGIINPTLLSSLNSDKLFLAYLSQCINTNLALEQWLTKLRRSLLLASDNINLPELASALALQCFANEYLFSVSAEEEQCLMEIEQATDKLTAQPNTLLASMYRPLIDIVADIKSFEHNNQPFLSLLIKRTLLDLQQEQYHQTRFRKIGNNSTEKITNSVSDQVRNQYEENPYPRWQIPPAPTPIALVHILQQLPGVEREQLPGGNVSVLIAGCGTGFEPIELARMDKNAQITALDLSSKSLAYAKRMADELRISNIDFVQGNILDAAELNIQFDLINSTGVLHHMENPQIGWQTLCGILKPGGVMRISLYSEFARQRVVLAHQKIKELQLGSSNKDIKIFRSTIFSLPSGSPLAELAQSDDFYSVSGCRDLLFHVQEHRFTLLQLKDMIAELGLIVIGFDVPSWAPQKFNQRYPKKADILDLTKWHEFEVSHPDTFVGMYQLWLQKINPIKN
ncbi:MAG TPA: methyltransferase domain-containing protein, partial [Cellvibrio sp.]